MNDPHQNPLTIRTPKKADYKRYNSMLKEIRTDIEIIDSALLRLSRNLKIIMDRQLYFCGGYTTFQEFCQKEIGKTRQHVYRLIQAHDVMQDLLVAGVPYEDLPLSERLCREVRLLTTPEQMAKAWKAVMRIARQEGRAPTIIDVQAVIAEQEKEDGNGSTKLTERQQIELLRKFEGVSRSLKVSIGFDLLEPSFRRRLVVVLTEIAETVTLLVRSLKHPAVENRAGSLTIVPPSED